jgi:hypothetical protein
MRSTFAFASFLAALLLSGAHAQQNEPTVVASPVSIKFQEVEFSNLSETPKTEVKLLCPAPDEIFGNILDVKTIDSNAHSDVDVQQPYEMSKVSNCIRVEAKLPPAIQVCANVPAPTWFNPLRMARRCSSALPVLLKLRLKYESIKSEAPQAVHVTEDLNTDRRGSDYANVEISELGGCQSLCVEDSRCRSYTFVPPNYKHENWYGPTPRCWLKYDQPRATPWVGLTSGIKLPVPQP